MFLELEVDKNGRQKKRMLQQKPTISRANKKLLERTETPRQTISRINKRNRKEL